MKIDELAKALKDALDSLEYVQTTLPRAVGYAVRAERIKAGYAALGVSMNTSTLTHAEFFQAYIDAMKAGGQGYSYDDIQSSWMSYQRDPAGHFLNKP